MSFVSAKYANAEGTQVAATDDRGHVWFHSVDSQVGDWVRYLANGGAISLYEAPPPPPLPPLSPRQMRLALADIGISESEIDNLLVNDPQGLIEWKWTTRFHRDHPLIEAIGPVFSLTPMQIDSLWAYAYDL